MKRRNETVKDVRRLEKGGVSENDYGKGSVKKDGEKFPDRE